MTLAPIADAAIDAQMRALFAGLTTLRHDDTTGRVIRGMLSRSPPANRWRTLADTIERGPLATPPEATERRILATRLRAMADGRPTPCGDSGGEP